MGAYGSDWWKGGSSSPKSVPTVTPMRRGPSAGYMRSGNSPFFWNWNPPLRDHGDDVRNGYYAAASRAIDSLQNSGWLAGAVDQTIASTIGDGLRLSARPDGVLLGWSDSQVSEWRRIVERRWITWSENALECDASGKQSMGEMQASVLRAYYSHGEALALLPYVSRAQTSPGTKVQLLSPHRLVADTNPTRRQWQGITIDSYGLPLSYKIRKSPDLIGTALDVRARDGAGRPQVIHIFEGRETQMRGITPLAPVLRVVKQFDSLADATLTAALIQAIFAATITSDAPTEASLGALQDPDEQNGNMPTLDNLVAAKAEWYENTKIDLGSAGKIAHLFPGEDLKFNASEHPNSTYEAFANFLLREIARCLGVTYETLTGNYSGATYSSVRMATAELWPLTLRRRRYIPTPFCQTVYEAWLEQEIEAETIKFPGGLIAFLANRPAVVPAVWRGPAKPQADDLKSAKATEIHKRLGVLTDEDACADLGSDWEDVYDQRAREKQRRAALDLPDTDAMEPVEDPEADEMIAAEDGE